MPGPKIETLSFAEIRRLAKEDPTQLTQGEGWKAGEEIPLGKDFDEIGEDFLNNWFRADQRWNLTAVTATLTQHPNINGPRQFGEVKPIIPDSLTTQLTFSAENPPMRGGGIRNMSLRWGERKVFLPEVFKFRWYEGGDNERFYRLESQIAPTKGYIDAANFGPLAKLDKALTNTVNPYYLTGESKKDQLRYKIEHRIEVDMKKPSLLTGEPASDLVVTLFAEDFDDRLRRDINSFRRARHKLGKSNEQATLKK